MEGNNNIQRPRGLLFVAILTFINAGFSFITYFMLAFAASYLPAAIDIYENMGVQKEMIEALQQLTEVPSWQFLLLSLSFALSIVGAAFMLKMNTLGFHLYVVSQLCIFAVSNLMVKGIATMNGMSIAVSVLFIFCYALFFKTALLNINNNDYTDYEDVIDEDKRQEDDE